MMPTHRLARTTSSLLMMIALVCSLASAAAGKPLLSDAIRAALDDGGVDAAKRRFAEIYPAQKDEYEIDMQALGEMGAEFMQAGDMASGAAIIEMTTTVARDMVAGQMTRASPELARQLEAAQAERDAAKANQRAAAREAREQELAERRGPARDDLARFTGQYGDPASPDAARRLWIQASCDGYLVAGATWGDAAPWWLKSLGERAFGVDNDVQSLHVEFEAGKAMRMHHDLEFMASPLLRVDDLPAEWGECLERREG